jgi:hypothetical protein
MIFRSSLHPRYISGAVVRALLALLAFPVAATADTPQHLKDPAIAVTVENSAAQRFDATALGKLPQHSVHAEAHGNAVNCVGPALIDVLVAAGAPSGEKLRGKNLALYVRISAIDGYRAVFALAELDPGFRDNVAIVTDRCNGAALDAKDGPFRLVVPDEKRPARWVRQVIAIDVLSAP